MFLLRPERLLHHRVTWLFCEVYRLDLDAFISGTPMNQLSHGFRRLVAAMLFLPIVERSIEAKHALVKMALYDAGMKGSTLRISFSNRLPQLRAQLERSPGMFKELLECFQRARNHKRVPYFFGLEHHPAFHGLRRKHNSFATKLLRLVLYRADHWTASESLSAGDRRHRSLRDAHEKAAAEALGDEDVVPLRAVDYAMVLHENAIKHFRSVADTASVYSLPTAGIAVSSLGESRRASPPKRARLFGPAADGDRLYFRLVSIRSLNIQRTAPLSRALTDKFDRNDLAISMHSCASAGDVDRTHRLFCEPLIPEGAEYSPCAVLTGLSEDIGMLQRDFSAWETAGDLQFTIQGIDHDFGLDAMGEVLSKLVVAGAFPSADGRLHVPAGADALAVLLFLETKLCAVHELCAEHDACQVLVGLHSLHAVLRVSGAFDLRVVAQRFSGFGSSKGLSKHMECEDTFDTYIYIYAYYYIYIYIYM